MEHQVAPVDRAAGELEPEQPEQDRAVPVPQDKDLQEVAGITLRMLL